MAPGRISLEAALDARSIECPVPIETIETSVCWSERVMGLCYSTCWFTRPPTARALALALQMISFDCTR